MITPPLTRPISIINNLRKVNQRYQQFLAFETEHTDDTEEKT